MKVILTAFQGKLRSEPMEFPDETRRQTRIHLLMDWDELKAMRTENLEATFEPTSKRAGFVATGKYFVLEDGKTTAEEYKLVEID